MCNQSVKKITWQFQDLLYVSLILLTILNDVPFVIYSRVVETFVGNYGILLKVCNDEKSGLNNTAQLSINQAF